MWRHTQPLGLESGLTHTPRLGDDTISGRRQVRCNPVVLQQRTRFAASPASLVSLYFVDMSRPVSARVLMVVSRSTRCLEPISFVAMRKAVHAFTAPNAALDAGNLYVSGDRIARHPEVMLECRLGRVLGHLGRSARDLGDERGGHGRSDADLGLAAALRTGERRVVLAQVADGRAGQQCRASIKVETAASIRMRMRRRWADGGRA